MEAIEMFLKTLKVLQVFKKTVALLVVPDVATLAGVSEEETEAIFTWLVEREIIKRPDLPAENLIVPSTNSDTNWLKNKLVPQKLEEMIVEVEKEIASLK